MTISLPRTRHALASVFVLSALVGPAAFLGVLAAEAPRTGAPPGLDLCAPGRAWAGFVAPKEPNYAIARLFNDFASPATALGPVMDGPDYPYANNEVAREMRGEERMSRPGGRDGDSCTSSETTCQGAQYPCDEASVNNDRSK
jgi:hypothetical protein